MKKYRWEELQSTLINILLVDNLANSDYDKVAEIFWEAVLDGNTIDKEHI